MNHKQKLGYMALGAGILAVGIMIGQFVTPDIEAQSAGVFDEITCRLLTVVDEKGKRRIALTRHGSLYMYDEREEAGLIIETSQYWSKFRMRSPKSNGYIYLRASDHTTGIDMGGDAGAILLRSTAQLDPFGVFGLKEGIVGSNSIHIIDKHGKRAFQFNAHPNRNELVVHDKSSGAGIGFYGKANEAGQRRWNPPHDK